MKIIGMDLGTTSTYLYGSDRLPPESGLDLAPAIPRAIVVSGLSDQSGSIATVVLYENGKPMLAGNIAESEFYSNLAAQPKRCLASQFKPEIASRNPEAMARMTDFLRILRESLPDGTLEDDTLVYAGMPSLSREDFALNLRACFQEAGWPAPAFARESDAALISCLESGSIEIGDLNDRCLILDFGGGTCDYTIVDNMTALQNGGDVLYGGRLFDDLFFQAFRKHDPVFAENIDFSPYEWYVHWVAARKEKERFSDFLGSLKNQGHEGVSLHLVWYDAKAARHESFLENYNEDEFTQAAESYSASSQMLKVLADYRRRGGLSPNARDLLAGQNIGLITWLRQMLASVRDAGSIRRVILTGGSSRWPFVSRIAEEIFPLARVAPSRRGYEDIAFGLALFPALSYAREKSQKLLTEKLPAFIQNAVRLALELAHKQEAALAAMCAEHIVKRDIMPVMEQAAGKGMIIADLENAVLENIRTDQGLHEIAAENSRQLREKIEEELNLAFTTWLRDNGVLLTPHFYFGAQKISQDFFEQINFRISRLDFLNIIRIAFSKVLPMIAGITVGGVIIHAGEPISAVAGGAIAGGATWLLARAAPGFLEKRKLPAFLLTERNRKKIIEKNKAYIERSLNEIFQKVHIQMQADIENGLKSTLKELVDKLGVINHIARQ